MSDPITWALLSGGAALIGGILLLVAFCAIARMMDSPDDPRPNDNDPKI